MFGLDDATVATIVAIAVTASFRTWSDRKLSN